MSLHNDITSWKFGQFWRGKKQNIVQTLKRYYENVWVHFFHKAFIFHYSKNYGSLIYETKFKVELNIVDLPCLFRVTFVPLIASIDKTLKQVKRYWRDWPSFWQL